jgi:phytoene dehydrogenase-like protein
MEDRTSRVDVAVIGGGLGGLAAATYVARERRSVLLCEKASALGGRAMTTEMGPFRFNLGPHALYAASHGIGVLRDLGVPFTGSRPTASGAFAIARGAKHALPGGLLSLMTTGLFGLPAKLETARLLGGIARIDPRPLDSVPVGEWIAQQVRHPDVRPLVAALVRVATYCNDPEHLSAGAALTQVQGALGKGVLYLDGGWQTLVDGLRTAATGAGATIRSAARAAGIERAGDRWALRLADGTSVDAAAVVIAAPPDAAASLLTGAEKALVGGWADRAIAVKAACLDIALERLPQPRATFALGIDQPLYLSVHSAVARFGPAGKAVVHVAKYLGTVASDPARDERELETLLDLVHPGWRELVLQRRFLPDMLVANDLPAATHGGTAGRPGPEVPNAPGLYVVGDWVGADGMLADASLASAKRAAGLILHRIEQSARAAA